MLKGNAGRLFLGGLGKGLVVGLGERADIALLAVLCHKTIRQFHGLI
jgi:hypothetical protein